MARHRKVSSGKKGLISKEIVVGVLAIGFGAFNIAGSYGLININVQIPQLIGNLLLVFAGLFLLGMAFKLGRYKYHTRHLF